MARLFDTAGDRVDYPNVFNWQGQPITISVWIKAQTTGDAYGYIWHVGSDDATFGMSLFTYNAGTDNRIKFGRAGTTEGGRYSSSSNPFTTNVWEHWLITHDGVMTTAATTIHIYQSGTEVTYAVSTNGVAEVSYDATNFSVGARDFDTSRDFLGDIAEIALWNRVLGGGEISALAKGFSPWYFPRSIKHYMPFIRAPRDRVTGNAGSVQGTASVSDHPLLINYPALSSPIITNSVPARFQISWANLALPASDGDVNVTPSAATAGADSVDPGVEQDSLGVSPAAVAAGADSVNPGVEQDSLALTISTSSDAGADSVNPAVRQGSLSVGTAASVAKCAATGVYRTLDNTHPSTDDLRNGWTDEGDGITSIYQSVDELLYSDTDYIQSSASPSTEIYRTKLGSGSDPGEDNYHYVEYRYKKEVASPQINLIVRLKQGTSTVIATWSHTDIPDSYVNQRQQLTTVQAGNITDYTDLQVEVEANEV